MSNEMNTGPMPSVTSNLNVGAENKKSISVDATALSSRGESEARGGGYSLTGPALNTMKPSNRDTYQ